MRIIAKKDIIKKNAELAAKTQEEIVAASRGKPGMKSASLELNNTARPAEISRAIMDAYQYFNRPCVSSDEECAERLNEYFQRCNATGTLPKVETMALALGTVREVVWAWGVGKGCSAERTNMIQKAKQILASIDAELAATGKIPQVVYIFRSKNFYGMKDQSDVVIAPGTPLGQDIQPETIATKYNALPEG